jgi:hypothetical protein
MNAEDFRAKAQRCRDLLEIAVKQEVKDQLREWADDFEAEAEAIEKTADHSRLARADR